MTNPNPSIQDQIEEPKFISIMVIKQGRIDFMAKVFELAHEWGEEEGYNMFIRNTSDGMYEIVGEPTETE